MRERLVVGACGDRNHSGDPNGDRVDGGLDGRVLTWNMDRGLADIRHEVAIEIGERSADDLAKVDETVAVAVRFVLDDRTAAYRSVVVVPPARLRCTELKPALIAVVRLR